MLIQSLFMQQRCKIRAHILLFILKSALNVIASIAQYYVGLLKYYNLMQKIPLYHQFSLFVLS